MEEVPKFARLEIAIDDFIDEQEDKNERAKTDRDISLLKNLSSQYVWNKKHHTLESAWTIFIYELEYIKNLLLRCLYWFDGSDSLVKIVRV